MNTYTYIDRMLPIPATIAVSTAMHVMLAGLANKAVDTSKQEESLKVQEQVVITIAISLAALFVPFLSYLLKRSVSNNGIMTRLLWNIAFAINVYTVSIPGRFDGQTSGVVDKKTGKTTVSNDFKAWETVFAPAGYAFAIWGVIYLGEFLLSSYTLLIGKPIDVIKNALPYWIAGNLFQSLWCFAFRPKFINKLYIPASLLLAAASSLFLCHNTLTNSIKDIIISEGKTIYTKSRTNALLLHKIGLCFFRFPIALHAGWLLAASCLNFNAWVTVSKFDFIKQIQIALTSSYLATLIYSIITIISGDPFISLTGAWAIGAIAYQTNNKSKLKFTLQQKNDLVNTELNCRNFLLSLSVAVFLFGLRKYNFF